MGRNGHIGRLNLTHAFYQVVGTDEFNAIEAREVDVNARMAAVEASVDKDWLRIKGSLFWATGDDDVNDGEATGFDSIVDIPVFAGGPFSVWIAGSSTTKRHGMVTRSACGRPATIRIRPAELRQSGI